MGKQSIDGDNNQTGQMLGALTGMGQGTFASEVKIGDGAVEVVREVDGGLQTVSLTLPAIITTDLRLNEPRYASLPNIMKAKKKPLETVTPEHLSVSVQSHVTQIGVAPPPERAAGIKVEDVVTAGRQTEKRSEGDLMKTLVIAEHDNASLKAATLNAVAAAGALGGDVDILVAGAGCGAAADAAAQVPGVSKVICADNAAYEHQLAENLGLLVAELGADYDNLLASSTANGKNIMPRVAALLDVGQISDILFVESTDTFKRPIYAGNVIATVQSSDPKKVITVRTTAFDAVPCRRW